MLFTALMSIITLFFTVKVFVEGGFGNLVMASCSFILTYCLYATLSNNDERGN